MRDAVGKPWEAAVPVGQANRRRLSESLDDVPHRPRLPSYPADRLPDLYGSLSMRLGINPRDGNDYPLSAEEMNWQLDFFQTLAE